MATKVKKNTKAETTANSEAVVNIKLGFSVNKQKFTINGDMNTIIELDPHDTNVVSRAAAALSTFDELTDKWNELNLSYGSFENVIKEIEDISDEEELSEKTKEVANSAKSIATKYEEIEKKMRDTIDYIFDSNVSQIILGNTSAWSPKNGKFKYEHIVEGLFSVYEDNIRLQAPKFNNSTMRKYTKKYHR